MFNGQNNQFYKSDLDLDPMTLVLKLDLDMVKMYHHNKSEVSMLIALTQKRNFWYADTS